LETIYGTALDDTRWSELFGQLRQATGVPYFALHGYDNNLQSKSIALLDGLDETHKTAFQDYYWEINPWLPGIARAPIGKAIYAEDFSPEEIVLKSEFYNDWARPMDNAGTGGGVVLFRDETRFLSLGGNIPFKHRDTIQDNWLQLIDMLSPHLRNAFELRRQLVGRQLTDATYLTALDSIGNAVFLLTLKGQVSYSNPAAHRLMQDGRLVYQDKFGALRPHESRAARTFGKALYDIGLGLPERGPLQLVINARDGGSKAVANLAPFTPDPAKIDKFAAFAASDVPRAILTITLPQHHKAPGPETLAALYRLTPAETQLALALYEGESLFDFADRRKVSRHTVRNQLRKVFEKTGVNSQSKLLSELNRHF